MNAKEISELMDKFDRSSLNEFRLADHGRSLYFSKLNQPGAVGSRISTGQPQSKVIQPASVDRKPAGPVKSSVPPKKPSAKAKDSIKAPLVGIVYFAPSPKKPAFAKVGAHVNKGDVVCQIEAMKVLNDVKAPKSGVIEKRLVKNGSMVQYHQPIFQIKAD